MVVKIMRWRPWPPLISKKYEVKLNVRRLEGLDSVHEGTDKDNGGLVVEIRWKGPKISLGSFRRSVKRNCTREEMPKRVDGPNGAVLVDWDEEFKTVCSLSGHKENVFHPWEISFTVMHWLKTDEESNANRTSVSEFGDDSFAVGSWEQKEITSRDGHLKIQTDVFFASIDQRSERAAGESACTALVAVIADWLQNNYNLMPIKSQFDTLIRDGSLEWRNLCENETFRERFADKHFDLETVIQAKICDLCVVPQKSFIGFFHPDGMEEGNFDFLHGAMSFDNIWDEMTNSEINSNGDAPVFIVSWNDHFFILKVESDAYYIIDTLGERLHEGCNQAYILKFDRSTTIYKLPSTSESSEEKPAAEQLASPAVVESQNLNSQSINSSNDCKEGTPVTENGEPMKNEQEEEVVCQGKESCKEYIQADMKKGLTMSTPLHHRLQIEIHFTQAEQPPSSSPAMEVVICTPQEVY